MLAFLLIVLVMTSGCVQQEKVQEKVGYCIFYKEPIEIGNVGLYTKLLNKTDCEERIGYAVPDMKPAWMPSDGSLEKKGIIDNKENHLIIGLLRANLTKYVEGFV